MKRRVFFQGCTGLALVGLTHGADEPKPKEWPKIEGWWAAGGRKHGPKARKPDTKPLDPVSMSWVTSKMWSFDPQGGACYFRPGKDETYKGEEVYFTEKSLEVGMLERGRILNMELKDANQNGNLPGWLFLVESRSTPEEADPAVTPFFFLAGAKGDQVTTSFDKEKNLGGRLVVMLKPGGRGGAREYVFHFAGGVPELVAPPSAKKEKKKE